MKRRGFGSVPSLFAICWQDTSEPWGWAPALPDGSLPPGVPDDFQPFYWDQCDAAQALGVVIAAGAAEYVPILRKHDHDRFTGQHRRREEAKSGKVMPGVTVTFSDGPTTLPLPPEPKPLLTDEELQAKAREVVSAEWSVQVYEVPRPPR